MRLAHLVFALAVTSLAGPALAGDSVEKAPAAREEPVKITLDATKTHDGMPSVEALAEGLSAHGISLKVVKGWDKDADGWLSDGELGAAGAAKKKGGDGWRGQFLNVDVDISLSS